MKVDMILENGFVITMDPERRLIENGSVVIDQGKIVAVGKHADLESAYQPKKRLDCTGKVIIPGLIDAHGHGGHSLIKTIASDTPSFWSKVITETYFNYTTDDFWYVEGKLSALERLKSGITCGLSVIGSQPRSDDPIFANNHARAYTEVGVREVVAVGPCNPPFPVRVSRWENDRQVSSEVSFEKLLDGASAAIETWNHGANDRIRVYITPFLIVPSLDSSGPTPPDIAPVLTDHDRLQSRRVRDIAEKYNTRIHSDAFGGMVKLASQDEYGLLGADVSLQHCNGLSMEEVEILAETDTRVGHTPSSSHGKARCPATELIDAGVTVAVVTDGTAPRRPFDLFQAARSAQLIHQLHFKDPFYLPAGKLLEMITIDAARVLGWEDEIGSLEVSKKADIAIINMRQPHLYPDFMQVHRLIYEAVGGDVETVLVDGRLVMEDRRVIMVDEAEALDQAQEEALRTIERADLRPHMEINETFWGQSRMIFDKKRWGE
jgi:5-methylthioadenosine/S-adenosylhomocysteine deaminase